MVPIIKVTWLLRAKTRQSWPHSERRQISAETVIGRTWQTSPTAES